jgi:hypothetical protein
LALVAGVAGKASDRAVEAQSVPDVVDGVSRLGFARASEVGPSALPAISLSFEPPKLFAQTIAIQVYMSFRTKAYFVSGPRAATGNGAILDVTSFGVTGHSPPFGIAWNSLDAVNADGSVPSLPQTIWFLRRVKDVSMKVGSRTSQGEPVTLTAYAWRNRVVDSDTVTAAPEMQTLSVSDPTGSIRYVVLDGPAVLVADDITYQ